MKPNTGIGAPRPRHANDVLALQACVRARMTADLAEQRAKRYTVARAIMTGAAIGMGICALQGLAWLFTYAGGR